MSGSDEPLARAQNDVSILQLVQLIRASFPALPVPQPFDVAFYGLGDDYGRARLVLVLSVPWPQISLDDIRGCGADLLFHISAEGLHYYLPAFLLNLLEHREFGWFEEALIPAIRGFEDVVEYFAGGAVYGPLDGTSKKYFNRVTFIRERLTPEQRECVAEYIEIAHSYGVKEPTAEFLHLLKKFTDFWRCG